ncbi:SCO7613 C-terminal domain-containing membrane protein [Agromyces salentinus]|uniref:DUF2157 domain-containing protein n=1 Tax=Agromyces salentinus TaxID=269421 RepID=A0ABN2MNM5_9MICO|nr:hypothetical protein [Agromyces salentinus]
MSDDPTAVHDGLPRWPEDPARFLDTTSCPSCFAALGSARCGACGLDLSVPEAVELLAIGRGIHDESVRRAGLIRRMYGAQATVEATARAAVHAAVEVPPADIAEARPVVSMPIPPVGAPAHEEAAVPGAAGGSTAAAAPAPGEVHRAPHVDAPPAPSPAVSPGTADDRGAATPRRSGVQVFLLTLGVVLISVAAIVFLFVAYLVASLEVRSVIIAVSSVLVLGVAWLLRARRLPGTAEGVASVAVVLLLLDVWIVRANGLFGSDRLDGAAYTGGAFLVVAALLGGARAASGIRISGLAAAGLVPTGVFLLALGSTADPGTGVWAGGLAASVVGSLSVIAVRATERIVLVAAGYAGGVIAMSAAATALPDVAWHQAWTFLGCALAWALAFVMVRRLPQAAWSDAAAVAVGLSLALAPAVSVFTELDSETAIWLAPAATGLVACLLAALVGRRTPRRAASWALGAGLIVAGSTAVFGVVIGIAAIATRVSGSVPPWWGPAATPAFDALRVGAAVVPLIVALGATAVLLLVGRLGALLSIPLGAFAITVLFTGAMVPSAAGSAAVLLGLGVAALLAAAFVRFPGGRDAAVTAVLASVGVVGAALGWIVGSADATTWVWVAVIALLVVLGGRVLSARIWPGAAAEAVGTLHSAVLGVLLATTLGALTPWLAAIGAVLQTPPSAGWVVLGTGAAVLVALASLVPIGTMGDRIAFAVPMLAAAMLSMAAILTGGWSDAVDWLPAAALAVAGIPWLRRTMPQAFRAVFGALVPLASATAAGTLAVVLLDPVSVGYVLAGVALVAAGAAHVRARPDPDGAAATWIFATIVVALSALVSAIVTPAEPWLILAVLSPVPIVLCAVAGDPIAGSAPTRHLSWLSAGLAIASVFAWLAGNGVDDVEAYTLPLAALLAASAVLITWRRTPAAASGTSQGRTLLFTAAAAVAVLPSIGSTSDSDVRTLVLVTGGAIVMLAAMFLPESSRGVPARLLAVWTGWTAASLGAAVRGTAVAVGEESPLPIEFWPLLATACGFAVAIAWARTASRPAIVAEWLAAASVMAGVVPTIAAIVLGDAATLRAGVLVTLLGAAMVASTAMRGRPFAGPVFGWTTRGALVVGGLFALASGNVDPFDVVTVPIGLALVAAGAITMTRGPIGTWPSLGPGLAVLLLPALGADFTDAQLWRVIALGVASLAILLVGVQRRLQAPFVLGGGVLLIHAVVQLWPAITVLYEAVWWWLWLGIAGVVLVVLAATYERQMRLARSAFRSVASMR